MLLRPASSRSTLRDGRFHDAETVARLLADEKLQQRAAGKMIWIDMRHRVPWVQEMSGPEAMEVAQGMTVIEKLQT